MKVFEMLLIFMLLISMPLLGEEKDPLLDLYARTYHISVKGDYLFASTTVGLTVYKLEGDRARQISALKVENGGSFSIIDGSSLYLFAGNSGIYRVDIGDPFRPRVIQNIRLVGSALHGDVYKNYLIVALGSMGFAILDKKLSVIKKVETPSYCAFTKVIDGKLIVSTEKNGIIVYSVNDPSKLKVISEINIQRRMRDVFVRDKLLFVADDTAGLLVFRVDHNNISFLEAYKTDDTARGVVGYKDCIFVADGNTGIIVFQIDKDNSLKLIKKVKTDYSTNKVTIMDQRLIISHDAMGVLVMDVNKLIN